MPGRALDGGAPGRARLSETRSRLGSDWGRARKAERGRRKEERRGSGGTPGALRTARSSRWPLPLYRPRLRTYVRRRHPRHSSREAPARPAPRRPPPAGARRTPCSRRQRDGTGRPLGPWRALVRVAARARVCHRKHLRGGARPRRHPAPPGAGGRPRPARRAGARPTVGEVDPARFCYVDTRLPGSVWPGHGLPGRVARFDCGTLRLRSTPPRPDSRRAPRWTGRDLASAGALVSYNGKSFDVPALEVRYILSRRGPASRRCPTGPPPPEPPALPRCHRFAPPGPRRARSPGLRSETTALLAEVPERYLRFQPRATHANPAGLRHNAWVHPFACGAGAHLAAVATAPINHPGGPAPNTPETTGRRGALRDALAGPSAGGASRIARTCRP